MDTVSESLWSLDLKELDGYDNNCPDQDLYNGANFNYSCPREYNCSDIGGVSIGIGPIPTYVSIISCFLSCIGSVLIFLTLCIKEARKSKTQRIITFLAIADFMQAFGYLLGAWNYLAHYNLDPGDPNYHHMCDTVFQITCVAQSFLTSWASIASFFWTCLLALEFYLAVFWSKSWTGKWYNFLIGFVIAWGVPLLVVIVFVSMGKLGYAPYAAANWCFVKSDAGDGLQSKEILIVLFNGKFWEISTYLIVIVLYFITKIHYKNQIKKNKDREQIKVKKWKEVNNRLLMIPIVFLLLRMWGTIQFFVSIGVADQNVCGCIPKVTHRAFFWLGIFQAIGDGGQGWGNAILYIFISSTIRKQLFKDPFMRFIGVAGRGFTHVGSKMVTAAEKYFKSSRLSKYPTVHEVESDDAELSGAQSEREPIIPQPAVTPQPVPIAQPAPPVNESLNITGSQPKSYQYGSTQAALKLN